MKFIVCIKQIVDITPQVKLNITTNRLPDNLNYIVNPLDENAVEEALRIKAKFGGEILLISAGPPRVSHALRKCLSMGADKAIRVWHPDLEGGDGYITAQVLASVIAPILPDLIICGDHSLDENAGQVPAALAEIIDLPQITGVTSLEILPERKKIIAYRKLEKGNREIIECQFPAVVSVEASINHPRYPIFRHIRWAQREPILECNISEMESCILDHATRFIQLTPPRPRTKKTSNVDINLSPEERLKQIMSGSLEEKKSKLWEGQPEKLAENLAQFLIDNHFVIHKN